MKNDDIAINTKNMNKDFIIYGDKANTLTERRISVGKSKKEL